MYRIRALIILAHLGVSIGAMMPGYLIYLIGISKISKITKKLLFAFLKASTTPSRPLQTGSHVKFWLEIHFVILDRHLYLVMSYLHRFQYLNHWYAVIQFIHVNSYMKKQLSDCFSQDWIHQTPRLVEEVSLRTRKQEKVYLECSLSTHIRGHEYPFAIEFRLWNLILLENKKLNQ